jgi:hypothetical protein
VWGQFHRPSLDFLFLESVSVDYTFSPYVCAFYFHIELLETGGHVGKRGRMMDSNDHFGKSSLLTKFLWPTALLFYAIWAFISFNFYFNFFFRCIQNRETFNDKNCNSHYFQYEKQINLLSSFSTFCILYFRFIQMVISLTIYINKQSIRSNDAEKSDLLRMCVQLPENEGRNSFSYYCISFIEEVVGCVQRHSIL